MTRRCWLMKSEPSTFSFDDLLAAPAATTMWEGVRNYQARNFMRDAMRPGDEVLFYHSNTTPPGVVGLAEVASEPYDDPTQFDPSSAYHDPKSTLQAPRWQLVDVRAVRALERTISLDEIKGDPELAAMEVARRGSRLSITPVDPEHYDRIVALAAQAPRR